MEMSDSRNKHLHYSIYSSKKLVGLILQLFEVFVWKILQQWRTLFQQIFSCTILTLWTDLGLGSLRGGVSGNALILSDFYIKIATIAISPVSMLRSKPIVVRRLMNSLIDFQTWSHIWLLAKTELHLFFQRLCIKCEKHHLTNWTRSMSLTPMTKNSSAKWHFWILNQFVCRKANTATPMLQQGLASTF